MTQKRKFRPSIHGLEQRLALNGAMSAAGLVAHGAEGTAEVHNTSKHHHKAPTGDHHKAPTGGHHKAPTGGHKH